MPNFSFHESQKPEASESGGGFGPARKTFTMELPAAYPTMNSITDNPVFGDERNFVRLAEKEQEGPFVNQIELLPGHEYSVYIGYHNNSAANMNASGQGIAQQVRLSVQFPKQVLPGEKGKVSAVIAAANTVPQEVWSHSSVTAASAVSLNYKKGTAMIHNSGAANGQTLPEDLFSTQGTYLGFDRLDGLLPGCAAWSGHVMLTLIAE